MAQALYRKWRPQTFEEVVGQEHVVRTLRNALTGGRIHHAYLFTGPRGTGKTTTARLLSKAVNCLAQDLSARPCNACPICTAINEGRLMDLIEIDAASNTGVDDVRELRERVGYRPAEARYKVYVIDEVHMLSNAAFNALLKTLEEPPAHAIFVLATTEPQRIPATVLSRCQRLDFRRVPLESIVDRLQHIADAEGFAADREALTLVARQATGSMRDAESLLDQLAAYADGGITVDLVQAALGTGEDQQVLELTDALAGGDVARGLTAINLAMDHGVDPRQLARQMVEHLRGLLLLRLDSRSLPAHVPESRRADLAGQADRFTSRQLVRSLRLFNAAAVEARAAWQPQLPLELALIEALLPAEEPPARSGESPAAPAPAARKSAPVAAAQAAPPADLPAPVDADQTNGELALEEIRRCWPDLLTAVRPQSMHLEAFLRDGQPTAVERNVVQIGFKYELHKGKVEEETNRRMVEEALGQLLGQPVQVRCVLVRSSKGTPAAPPAHSAPPPAPTEAEDQLVRAAVQKLGARVVKTPKS